MRKRALLLTASAILGLCSCGGSNNDAIARERLEIYQKAAGKVPFFESVYEEKEGIKRLYLCHYGFGDSDKEGEMTFVWYSEVDGFPMNNMTIDCTVASTETSFQADFTPIIQSNNVVDILLKGFESDKDISEKLVREISLEQTRSMIKTITQALTSNNILYTFNIT